MEQVKAFCEQWGMLPRDGLVLCAVSGGRDSMVLLHLLCALAREGGFQITAAHFNHQLRPTAGRDEAFVRDWCAGRGIPFRAGSGDVAAYARETGSSLEDAARQLRYRFLEESADALRAVRIATAHHREDNAETVLLHLLRGSGLGGLGGIPPVRGRIVRPLLEASRAEIDAYAAAHQISFVEDETNREAVCTRNRLRLEILPLLEKLSPGCAGRMAGTAALLREEEAHLQREADALLPPEADSVLPVPLLNRQDGAMRRRLVRTAGLRLGVSLSREQVAAILALGSGGHLDLPGGLCASRNPHQLVLRRQKPLPPPLPLHLGEQDWGPWQVLVRRSPEPPVEGTDTVALIPQAGPLSIAAWDGTGRLAVENGSRTIKRLFADRGIPVERRAEHPALFLDGIPAAVFGVATDWNLRPQAEEPCLVVSLARRQKGCACP